MSKPQYYKHKSIEERLPHWMSFEMELEQLKLMIRDGSPNMTILNQFNGPLLEAVENLLLDRLGQPTLEQVEEWERIR